MADNHLADFNILLIDDEPITRHLLNGVLQKIGFSAIHVASDGDEGLTILADSKIDLVITDLEMPGTNGLALLKAIRCGKTKQPSNTCVMVITSHEEMAVLGTAIALDADAIINKTISLEHLKQRINHLLLGPKPELRPAIAYEVLDTEKPLQQASELAKLNNKPGKSATLDTLVEGMILAEPVVKSGCVIMQTGERLTLGKISLLQDLAECLELNHVTVVAD